MSSHNVLKKKMAPIRSAMNDQSNKSAQSPTYPNFFPAAENDFAARLKWSVTPKYANANHEPSVKVEGPLKFLAFAGDKIRLNASVSDPDGNAISIKWWQFQT